ncbi:MAG: hypothetical protein D3904_03285 [Candidatus Electrothrix sp. EH2]|nr:hypothetical protein [Candidatus Electrothrix sp. EH2]
MLRDDEVSGFPGNISISGCCRGTILLIFVMDNGMKNFKKYVKNILKEKGYEEQCPSLEEFSILLQNNRKFSSTKVCIYKWGGLFLLTVIPITSVVLSTLVGLKGNFPKWLPEDIILPISLGLAICTTINSLFRPNERFRDACRITVKIDDFMTDFLIELERMTTVDHVVLLDMVEKKKKEFMAYQINLIDIFLPIENGKPYKEKNNDK